MYLKINFLGLNELALFLWKQNTVQRKKTPKFQNIIGNLWPSGGRGRVARWLCLHTTTGARHRCCCSLNSGSQGVWLLPPGSASPTCQDASAPWVALGTTTVPGGWPTSGVGTAAAYPLVATAASPGSDSASSRSKRPQLCLGTLVSALDLPLGFLYSCSIITVVTWPQIQWHPDDPAAGLGRLQVQLPFTSLGHF